VHVTSRASSPRKFPGARLVRTGRLSLAAWTLALAACGGSGSADSIPTKPVDTSTLVGTWTGSVNGDGADSFGYSTTLTELRTDSTFTMTAVNANYGTLSGKWTVAAGKWTASGRDQTNSVITLTALHSPTTLTGTWTATSGRTGVFTMAKLP
jgi:hypothetical protein